MSYPGKGATLSVVLAAATMLAACQSDLTGRTAANNEALAAGFPFQFGNRCDGEVSSTLIEAGVSPASVDSISYMEQRSVVRGESQVIGFDANVRMIGQPGLMVVDLTEECFVRQTYTRGGLEVPGVAVF